jgi:hypothetical protein
MDIFQQQQHPILSLLLWIFRSRTNVVKEPDEPPTMKRIDWSYNDFETQIYTSTTPPSEVYPARRVKKGGGCTPPILKYSASSLSLSSSSLSSLS